MSIITTSEFRIRQSAFVSGIIAEKCFWWIFACVLSVIVSAVFGIFLDLRFLVVSLMIILLVAPMMLFYVYFNEGLTKENAPNILPHRLTISEQGIIVEVSAKVDEDGDVRMARFEYPARNVGVYKLYGGGLVIPVKGESGRAGRLLLPYDALAGTGELERVVEILRAY